MKWHIREVPRESDPGLIAHTKQFEIVPTDGPPVWNTHGLEDGKSKTHVRISLRGGVLAPRLTLNGKRIKLRRVGPASWEFPLKKKWKSTPNKPWILHLPDDTNRALHSHDVAVKYLHASEAAATYHIYAEFLERREHALFEFHHSTDFTFARQILKTRYLFPEIDLIFLYHSLTDYDDDVPGTKAAILEHFSKHRNPTIFEKALDDFTEEGMQNIVDGLLARSDARLGAWPLGKTPDPLPNWNAVNLTEEQAITLAQALASIFDHHCFNLRRGGWQKDEARLSVLYFASGLSRMTDEVTSPVGTFDAALAFNAEPNSAQFRAFAEFVDLVIRRLKLKLKKWEYKVMQDIFHALIIGIELFTRAYAPYPIDANQSNNKATPPVLARLLANGRDPRPDNTLIQRALNRVEYFAGEEGYFTASDGVEPFWGALLWNIHLRKSTGVLPGVAWQGS